MTAYESGRYPNGSTALLAQDGEETEVLSVNLTAYGLHAPDGHVFVKDYSEHSGLPVALEAADVAHAVRVVVFGPFRTTAVLMKLGEYLR